MKLNQKEPATPDEPTLSYASPVFSEEIYDVYKLTFKVLGLETNNSFCF
jgi:hypothetical protein